MCVSVFSHSLAGLLTFVLNDGYVSGALFDNARGDTVNKERFVSHTVSFTQGVAVALLWGAGCDPAYVWLLLQAQKGWLEVGWAEGLLVWCVVGALLVAMYYGATLHIWYFCVYNAMSLPGQLAAALRAADFSRTWPVGNHLRAAQGVARLAFWGVWMPYTFAVDPRALDVPLIPLSFVFDLTTYLR